MDPTSDRLCWDCQWTQCPVLPTVLKCCTMVPCSVRARCRLCTHGSWFIPACRAARIPLLTGNNLTSSTAIHRLHLLRSEIRHEFMQGRETQNVSLENTVFWVLSSLGYSVRSLLLFFAFCLTQGAFFPVHINIAQQLTLSPSL